MSMRSMGKRASPKPAMTLQIVCVVQHVGFRARQQEEAKNKEGTDTELLSRPISRGPKILAKWRSKSGWVELE